jgi:hypothetical protein
MSNPLDTYGGINIANIATTKSNAREILLRCAIRLIIFKMCEKLPVGRCFRSLAGCAGINSLYFYFHRSVYQQRHQAEANSAACVRPGTDYEFEILDTILLDSKKVIEGGFHSYCHHTARFPVTVDAGILFFRQAISGDGIVPVVKSRPEIIQWLRYIHCAAVLEILSEIPYQGRPECVAINHPTSVRQTTKWS